MTHEIIHGNSLEVLTRFSDNHFDSCITDPPYELGFMGKKWDSTGIAYSVELYREVLRVLKPGGHLLSFGGTRTYHRMACAIEDAGFEVRDQMQWIYGSGFPKSLDVSKAIDKEAGAEREIVGSRIADDIRGGNFKNEESNLITYNYTAPATPAAKQWQGWGTALKPANEPICVARKPFKSTVAENVLQWGTGALNIDGSRIGTEERFNPPTHKAGTLALGDFSMCEGEGTNCLGRWPSNVLLDEEAAKVLDLVSDNASRFFYTAKASKLEREAGLDKYDTLPAGGMQGRQDGSLEGEPVRRKNFHPTVKPIDLMEYLIKLVTPPNGLVLDPFAGSGTTGCAAVRKGFSFIGIELDEKHADIARGRIRHMACEDLFG